MIQNHRIKRAQRLTIQAIRELNDEESRNIESHEIDDLSSNVQEHEPQPSTSSKNSFFK